VITRYQKGSLQQFQAAVFSTTKKKRFLKLNITKKKIFGKKKGE
jgi:hypothetical protein